MQNKELLKKAIKFTCNYLTDWEQNNPETYSNSQEVAEMNDFLVEIENTQDDELIDCIVPIN